MKQSFWKMFAAVVLLAACEKDPQGGVEAEPPQTTDAVLMNEIVHDGVYGADAVFTFDQNVKCPPSCQGNIRISPTGSASAQSEVSVTKVIVRDNVLTVSLEGLESGVQYTLVLPEGTVSGFKDNPCREIVYVFLRNYPVEKDYDIDVVPDLSDPKADENARTLYALLLENYGKTMLSGVQSGVGNHQEGVYAKSIKDVSGHYPAIQGFDYIFQHWGETNWTSITEINAAAMEHWNNGGIVTMCWHWNVPSSEGETDPSKYGFYISGEGSTSFDIREALREGTWQNKVILDGIDRAAANLKMLSDLGIPVLWRPLHEAAGDFGWGAWFWWGRYGCEYTTELWRLMYDRMVNVHGLHNLIWVWTFQTSDQGAPASFSRIAETYPGDEYVDIVGADLYEGDHSLFTSPVAFKTINNVVKGRKMLALTECGNLPDAGNCIGNGEPWAWFMSWTDDGFKSWNSAQLWKSVLSDPKVTNREELKNM